MANPRQFDLEDIVNRPGTYFNPQTEVLVIIDDSPDIDTEIFNLEDFEGADWVLISDESPIDESARDELMQAFQVRHGAGSPSSLDAGDDLVDDTENAPPEADEIDE
jgi:sugar/nucleoside kinase (ribokinase family)